MNCVCLWKTLITVWPANVLVTWEYTGLLPAMILDVYMKRENM